MDKRTAVKAALCVMAVIALTSAFAERLWPNTRPTGDVCLSRGELSGAPLRATAPGIPDDLDSPPGNGSLPADKAGPEGKAPPSQIKLDIILTMRRPRIAAGRHRAHRAADKLRIVLAGSLADEPVAAVAPNFPAPYA